MEYLTYEDMPEFRKAYENCRGKSFIFKGTEILKQYAKYVLEYFDMITKEAECKKEKKS